VTFEPIQATIPAGIFAANRASTMKRLEEETAAGTMDLVAKRTAPQWATFVVLANAAPIQLARWAAVQERRATRMTQVVAQATTAKDVNLIMVPETLSVPPTSAAPAQQTTPVDASGETEVQETKVKGVNPIGRDR
jgi:hypothetical protein